MSRAERPPGRGLRHAGRAGAITVALATGARAHGQLPIPFGGSAPDTAGQGRVARAAQTPVALTVADPGPGMAGRTLRAVLDRQRLVVVSPDTGLTFGRDVRVDRALVVTRGPLRLAGRVQGDVVVFGDLFLRPGAQIDGRAVAIGGGVYNSTLALVLGGTFAYRDLHVDLAPAGAAAGPQYVASVRSLPAQPVPSFTLPGVFGLHLPSYDRIDGLSLSFSPELTADTGRVRVDPFVTYRSHLGAFDPGVRVQAELGGATAVRASVERATLTNEAWIRDDFSNSVTTFASGDDARNYYRAVRGEATVARAFDVGPGVLQPYVGGLVERSSSVARDTGSTSAPYSVTSRRSLEGVRRANPGVTGGRVTSALAGAQWNFEGGRLLGHVSGRVEQSLGVERGSRFTQVTVDAALIAPTEADPVVVFLAHAVGTTGGRNVPSQRYAYLGGSGTLPTLFQLAEGGTELVWGEARYTVPVPGLRLPVGVPRFTARAMAGAAGLDALPALTPNLGVRAAVSLLRVDFVFDPRGRGRRVFSLGFGLR